MAGLAALAIAYVLSQFYRSFLAVLTPALSSDLGATNAELSLASGAWFFAFALAQFIVGVSLDRYGPKRTCAVLFAIGGGGGAALFSVANQPWMITAAMALIGLGCAPVLMSAVFIFARTFRPAQLAILTSWMVGFGSAGNVLGAAPLAAAAEAFGWRGSMAVLGLLTLAVAGAILFFVEDPREPAGSASGGSGFSGYLELFRLRAVWLILPLIALNYAPVVGIRGLWAGPYLAEVYDADTLAIGRVTFLMALAMVAGSFIYGPLDTLFGTRKWVAVVGNSIGVAALVYLALEPASSLVMVTVMLAVIGVAGNSYGLLMAHGRAFLPAHMTGRGMTMLNFFSMGGAGLMQFATGAVVTTASNPGEPASGYSALFWFYAATVGLAILSYLFARDAKPEKHENAAVTGSAT